MDRPTRLGHPPSMDTPPPEDRDDPPRPAPAFEATSAHGEITLRMPYDPDLVARVRTLPGRRWDGKARVWRLRDTPEARAALRTTLGVVPDVGAVPTTGPHPSGPTSSGGWRAARCPGPITAS
jgi:hypothetical protein